MSKVFRFVHCCICVAQLTFSAGIANAADWSPQQIEMSFDSWWSDEGAALVPIARVLVKNKIRVCGEFAWAESRDLEEVYLVGCVIDDKHARYYLVSTHTNRLVPAKMNEIQQKPLCFPRLIGRCNPDYAKKWKDSKQRGSKGG